MKKFSGGRRAANFLIYLGFKFHFPGTCWTGGKDREKGLLAVDHSASNSAKSPAQKDECGSGTAPRAVMDGPVRRTVAGHLTLDKKIEMQGDQKRR